MTWKKKKNSFSSPWNCIVSINFLYLLQTLATLMLLLPLVDVFFTAGMNFPDYYSPGLKR